MSRYLPDNAYVIPPNAKKVFSGEIFDVYQWPQKMFDGSVKTFEMLKRPDTVVAMPIIDGKVLISKEFQPSWSAPRYSCVGGRMDPGEDPFDAVKREALEETGYEFSSWKLVEVSQSSSKIEWFVYIFVAEGVLHKGAPAYEEDGEQIEPLLLEYDEILRLAKGELRLDAFTHFASLEELINSPVIAQ